MTLSAMRGAMLLPKRILRWSLSALALLAVQAAPVLAQGGMPGSLLSDQSLRPYRFVFIAYAIVWLLVLGWVISVARRMAKLNQRLGD